MTVSSSATAAPTSGTDYVTLLAPVAAPDVLAFGFTHRVLPETGRRELG